MLPRISQQNDAPSRLDHPRPLVHAGVIPRRKGPICRGSAHVNAPAHRHEFQSQCRQLFDPAEGHAKLALGDWEREVLQWAEWNSLLATAVDSYYLRHVWNPLFILSVIRLVLALLRHRLVNLLRPSRTRL